MRVARVFYRAPTSVVALAIVSVCGLLGGCQSSGDADVKAAERPAAEVEASAEPASSPPPQRTTATAAPAAAAASSNGSATAKRADTLSSEMAYPTGDRSSSVLLIERTAPAQVRLGRPYAYDIKVTNLTKTPLQGVVVSEEVPDNFRVTMADNGKSGVAAIAGGGPTTRPAAGRTLNRYMVGELGAGEARLIRLSALTDKPDRAFATCLSVNYNPTLCSTAMIVSPQVKLSVAAPEQIDLCAKDAAIQYTLTNSGTGAETDIKVSHQLPEGLQTIDGKKTVAFDVPLLAQGETKAYSVKLAPQKAGAFKTQAIAQTPGGDVKSEEMATKVVAPKLTVAVKAPEKDYAGQSIAYEITVKNTGTAPARDAFVALDTTAAHGSEFLGFGETAPGEAQLAAAREPANGGAATAPPANARLGANGGAAGVRETRQSLGTLEPGQSRTIRANLRSSEGGPMQISAVAEAPCAGRVSAMGKTTIQTLPALLMEVVDRADPIRIGENQVYTIRITNQGFGEDKDVQVVATLPDGEEFVKAAGATEGTADGKKVTFAPVAVLKAKQTATWTVEVKAIKPGDMRFQVDLTSDSLTKPATETEPTRLY